MARPQPEQYRSRSEYRWAVKLWKRKHGGSLIAVLAIALVFGALTGSGIGLLALVAFAVVMWMVARSRP
jgi:hypothetical protein